MSRVDYDHETETERGTVALVWHRLGSERWHVEVGKGGFNVALGPLSLVFFVEWWAGRYPNGRRQR